MDRKMLTLLAVPLLALAVAASAVALVPGILNAFSAGPTNATSIATPAWKVGDTWTYNVSFGTTDTAQVLPGEMLTEPSMPTQALVVGQLTETVVGRVSTPYGQAWNTTVDVSMDFGQPQPMVGTQPVMQPMTMPAATVSGFVWYRASDLAPVFAQKTVTLSHTWTANASTFLGYTVLGNATYTLSYTSTTQVWYHPPLTVWSFPLVENESWNATSNATIHYASTFEFTGPNMTFEASHSANFTVPIGFGMRTGAFENVTTPAGTFRALSVSAFRGEAPVLPDRDASATMNLTGEMDFEMPHPMASAWFSGQVGNVVKADVGLGFEGPRVELDLVSYSFS